MKKALKEEIMKEVMEQMAVLHRQDSTHAVLPFQGVGTGLQSENDSVISQFNDLNKISEEHIQSQYKTLNGEVADLDISADSVSGVEFADCYKEFYDNNDSKMGRSESTAQPINLIE